MKSNYGLAMDQEANTRGTESMRGDLEGIERILSDGMSRAGRENGTPLMVGSNPTHFQQGLNKALQRRSTALNDESTRNEVDHKPMFRSPLDDSWVGPLVPEWGNLDVNTSYRLSIIKTLLVVTLATAFGIMTWLVKGKQSAMEFAAGYLVEQSLSIDNLFVFILLFNYFSVPLEHQGRVLWWGVLGAVVMRGFMIALGVAVVKKFTFMIVVFAGILLASSVKLLQEGDDEHNLGDNAVMKLAKKLVGVVDRYDGDKFFTSNSLGRTVGTPMLLCLVCIELTDFIFAVDSIPAVLGISQDPFVVYSSNIFAIMSLRSVYSIIAKAVTQLQYLKPAVAIVLGFVGIKMILEFLDFDIPTVFSLSVVMGLIGGGIVLSIAKNWWTRFGSGRKGSQDITPVDVAELV